MYRFQVSAHTNMGESIALLGSTAELGFGAFLIVSHYKQRAIAILYGGQMLTFPILTQK